MLINLLVQFSHLAVTHNLLLKELVLAFFMQDQVLDARVIALMLQLVQMQFAYLTFAAKVLGLLEMSSDFKLFLALFRECSCAFRIGFPALDDWCRIRLHQLL